MLKFNVPVHFEFDSSELREADRPVLDRFAAVVKEYYPGALVTVEGFTDPVGQRRLQPAARPAARRGGEGVSRRPRAGSAATTLKAVSYGEVTNRQVVPGAKGPGEEGIENRRVALVIDHAAIATDQVSAIQ